MAATSDLVVVRLHGHSGQWTSKKIEERFAYLYSEAELWRWAAGILHLAEDARIAHVLFNNCCGDASQRNAARFRTLIDELGRQRTAG